MLVKCSYPFPNGSTTSNRRGFDVDITSFVEDQILTNFHVLPRTFFDVISLVEKSTLFPRTFIGVISLVDKSTPFPRMFFDGISIVEKTFHHINLMSKNSTSFLVSYKLMKTFEEVFLCL